MFKKTMGVVIVLLLFSTIAYASEFNLPLSWIRSPNGTTVDANTNGIIDTAENAIEWSGLTSTAGITVVGTIVNGVWQGTAIADAYIANSTHWNAKADTGNCAAGFVVQNTTTGGVECISLALSETDPLSWHLNGNNYPTADLYTNYGILMRSLGITTTGGTYTANITNPATANTTLSLPSSSGTLALLSNFIGYNTTTELHTIFLNITDQRYNDSVRIDALNTSKLDASDQRYNDTALINAVNATVSTLTTNNSLVNSRIDALNTSKLDKTDQRYNESTRVDALNTSINGLLSSNTTTNSRIDALNISKLNSDDQRYNETGLINSVNTTVTGLVASNTTTNGRIDALNASKLDATDQRYNDTALANQKTLPGTCPEGYAVQNTTTGGVECTSLASVVETDPVYTAENGTIVRTQSSGVCAYGIANYTLGQTSSTLTCVTPPTTYMNYNGNNSNVTTMKFNLSSVQTVFAQGEMGWDTAHNALSVGYPYGATLQIGEEMYKEVVNIDSVTLTEGMAVSLVGVSGNREAVMRTNISNVQSATAFIGLVTTEMTAGSNGLITLIGDVHNLNTDSFTEGNPVYVSSTPGVLTQSFPTAPDFIVMAGVVTVKNANVGVIAVTTDVYPRLSGLSDVDGTPIVTSGQILVWNQTRQVWDATSNINNYLLSADSRYNYSAQISGIQTNISAVNSSLTTTIGRVDAINSTVVTHTSQIGGIQSNISSVNSSLTTTIGRVDAINSTVVTHTSQISGIQTNVSAVNASLTTTIGRVDSINSTVVGLVTQNTTTIGLINGVNTSATILARYAEIQRDPQGFNDTTSTAANTHSTLAFNPATLNFTITPVGSYSYYFKGQLVTKTTPSGLVITNTTGVHIIYFNSAGVLEEASSLSEAILCDNVIVGVVVWNAARGFAYMVEDERHTHYMECVTHYHLHEHFGTLYDSGLSPTLTVGGATSSNASAQVNTTAGSISDEDYTHDIAAVTGVGQYRVYYQLGATGNWSYKIDDFPFIYSGDGTGYTGANGRIAYNLNTGGTWSLAQTSSNGNYVLAHFFATNSVNSSADVIVVQGQNQYATLALARSGADTEISSIASSGLLGAESKALYTITIQSSGAWTNVPKAIFVAPSTGGSYIDWRTSKINGVSGSVLPGSVTLVDTGLGLTGGPITGSGTISIDTTYMSAFANKSASETVTGNWTFNTSTVTGRTVFDSISYFLQPTYFQNNVILTQPLSGRANTSLYVTDIAGITRINMTVAGIVGTVTADYFKGALTGNADTVTNGVYTNTIVDLVGNWSADKASYLTSASAALTYVARNDWTTIDNYPSACSAGDYVTQVGDTLTCGTPIGTTYSAGSGLVLSTTTFSLNDTYANDRWNDTAMIISIGNWTADKPNYLTTVGTAADSSKLGGQLPTYYLNSTQGYVTLSDTVLSIGNWSADKPNYLTTIGTAADSSKLGGQLPTYYLNSTQGYATLSATATSIGNWSADKSSVAANITSVNATANTKALPGSSNVCAAGTHVANFTLSSSGVPVATCTADDTSTTPYQSSAAGWSNTTTATSTSLNVNLTATTGCVYMGAWNICGNATNFYVANSTGTKFMSVNSTMSACFGVGC